VRVFRAPLWSALLLVVVGCQPLILSAHNSINPVMIGPVRSLPQPGPGAALERVGTFNTELAEMTAASSTSSTSGNVTTTTMSSTHMRSATTEADWAVFTATSGDPDRQVYLDTINCGGWAFFMVFGLMATNSCQASGAVMRAVPTTVAAPPAVWRGNNGAAPPAPPQAPPEPPAQFVPPPPPAPLLQ